MALDTITKEEYFKLTNKQNKYHNKLVTDAFGNIRNHSKKEARMANDFYLELKAGKYLEVQEQYTLQLFVRATHICNIVIDFYLKHKDGSVELVECKSEATKTAAWKIKWALAKATHPEFIFTVIT